jgi:TetR/AcrR family transcriptional regulator, cholesterol catabolism regulator
LRGRVWGQDHPEMQRRLILEAARKLFLRDGIERVGIADIAAEAGLTRATLYQYFANKEDIAWALAQSIFEQTRERVLEPSLAGASSGYEAIERLFAHIIDQLLHDPDQVNFMAQFDHMYARHWSVERLVGLEALVVPGMVHLYTDLIRRGIADGSLRSDLDPTFNALVAVQRRFAFLGSKVEAEYGQSTERMLREVCRIILLGLKASET